MNPNKIRDFVNDKIMAESVYRTLKHFFLKKRDTKDVTMLAVERLSALLLEDAWKDLQKFGQQEKPGKIKVQQGL